LKARWWLAGLGIALVLVLLSPLASPDPDGLERVAENHGFIERALQPVYQLIPDYAFPGIADERLATVVAGAVGVLAVFGVTWGAASLLGRARSRGGAGPRR
jgi:hypothetical protein